MRAMRRVRLCAACLWGAAVALAGCHAAPVSAKFSLSLSQLNAMLGSLPPQIQELIHRQPAAFLDLMADVLDEPADLLILVDKSHPLASDYAPPDLVKLSGYDLALIKTGLELRKAIMRDVVAMSAAARADGVTLHFSSTYRSFADQRWVYNNEVQTYGRDVADRESAQPGCSQHQLGTAIDFGSITDDFARTGESAWLEANAWKYGFTLSYPQGYEWLTGYRYESWHYRDIGKQAARMQREFFENIQQYMLVFLHDYRGKLESARVRTG